MAESGNNNMSKIIMTVVHPNNGGTTLVIVDIDDTVESIFQFLVDNYFIVGEQYYSANIGMDDKKIEIMDFSQQLSELGVKSDATLYISHGMSEDYKAPRCSVVKSKQTEAPPKTSKKKSPKIKIKAVNGMNLEDLPLVDWKECLGCKHERWIFTQLHSLREAKNDNDQLKGKNEELLQRNMVYEIQIERRETAEWFLAIAPIVVGIGSAFITEPLGIAVATLGVGLTIYGMFLSHKKAEGYLKEKKGSTQKKGSTRK